MNTHAATLLTAALTGVATAAAPEPKRVPTLDELLGLESAPGTTEPQQSDRLDSTLDPNAPSDPMTETLALMDDATRRLVELSDPGITTQRVQESIVLKLDQLIAQARQQQSSQSSSSSSSSSSDQSNQPNQQSSAAQSASNQPGSDAGERPGSDELVENNSVATSAAWGNLPERLRDALTQGLDDPYSSLYRDLTEQYYKQLAEDDE